MASAGQHVPGNGGKDDEPGQPEPGTWPGPPADSAGGLALRAVRVARPEPAASRLLLGHALIMPGRLGVASASLTSRRVIHGRVPSVPGRHRCSRKDMVRLLRLGVLLVMASVLANPPPDLPGTGRRGRGRSKPCPTCRRRCMPQSDGWYYCSDCNEFFPPDSP